MHIEKMQSLAEALVANGVLTKSTSNITMSLSVLGYSSSEVFKRNTALPSVTTYAPNNDDAELSLFCQELNRGLAQKVAAEEMLISTPYHLLKHGDIERLLSTARKFEELKSRLACMTLSEIFDTLMTKDTNKKRSVSRHVKQNKLIELKVGSFGDPVYPTFQLDENASAYSTLPLILDTISQNGMSTLDFCLWIADEDGFIATARKVSRKYFKSPFRIFSDEEDTEKLLAILFEPDDLEVF